MAKYVPTTGTLTNTTVALASKDRQGLLVGNPSDTVMTVAFGATASATVGIPVPAGTAIFLEGRSAPDDAVSVFCAGTSKAYSIYEW
jgi:hypothetical protein